MAATEERYDADDMYYSVGYAIAEKTLTWNKRKMRIQFNLMYVGLFFVILGVALLLVIALQNLPARHTSDIVRVVIVTPTP